MSIERDRQRIQEELEGVERPPRPRGLASDYLHQAAEAFHAAGDPADLYRQWRPNMPPAPMGRSWMHGFARQQRFRHARTCVLFSALAAEAFVNEFLAAFDLFRSRLKTLDNLSTVGKYIEGTEVAFGAVLFRDDDEVMPTSGSCSSCGIGWSIRSQGLERPSFSNPTTLRSPPSSPCRNSLRT